MTLNQVLNNLKELLSFSSTRVTRTPSPLVLLSDKRSGMSAIEMAAEMLAEKQKLGIPVGTLPNGEPNLDDILEEKRFQIIINTLINKANLQVAINPLGNVTTVGTTADGTPVTTTGVVTSIQTGGCVIK